MPTGGADLDKSGHYSSIEPSVYAHHLLFSAEDFSFANTEYTYLTEKLRKTDLMSTIPYSLLVSTIIVGVEGLSCKPNGIYKIHDIIGNLELMDAEKEPVKMVPFFPNHSGSIHIQNDDLICVGKLKYIPNTYSLQILALPFTISYFHYKKTLNVLKKDCAINGFTESKKPDTGYIVSFSREKYNEYKRNPQNFYKNLKLIERLEEKFVALNGNNQKQEYKNVLEMLKEFYELRIKFYRRRPNIETREDAIKKWRLDRTELMKALPPPIRESTEENIVPYTSN
ncbi:hypothetical protein DMENIID0001_069750 [Sergentomyia squamirostris]